MKKAPEAKKRCAIYTRKSTEEGLEQEFNSLDAQRESAEAYIKSQQHQGWQCIPTKYDDGGYTGGNMERPALKRLMADKGKQKVAVTGPMKAELPPGRIPRISPLMALAIRFDELIRSGQVSSYAELARLGHVTPARVTHIMNLNLLSPAIQEWLLFLPRTTEPERLHLKDVQRVARVMNWRRQQTLVAFA